MGAENSYRYSCTLEYVRLERLLPYKYCTSSSTHVLEIVVLLRYLKVPVVLVRNVLDLVVLVPVLLVASSHLRIVLL